MAFPRRMLMSMSICMSLRNKRRISLAGHRLAGRGKIKDAFREYTSRTIPLRLKLTNYPLCPWRLSGDNLQYNGCRPENDIPQRYHKLSP